MTAWAVGWSVLVVFSLAAFTVMSLLIVTRGLKELITMLRGLRDSEGNGE
jgi:hypothetical protein